MRIPFRNPHFCICFENNYLHNMGLCVFGNGILFLIFQNTDAPFPSEEGEDCAHPFIAGKTYVESDKPHAAGDTQHIGKTNAEYPAGDECCYHCWGDVTRGAQAVFVNMADGARLLHEDIHKEHAERNCENPRFIREHFEQRHAQKDDGERDQKIDGNGAVREHFIEPVGLLVSARAVQTACQKRVCISATGAEKIGIAENIRAVNFGRRGGPRE